MYRLFLVVFVLFLSGCTTINYGSDVSQKHYSMPSLGLVTKSYIGDYMVNQGVATTMKYLIVDYTIDGAAYDIPKGSYVQVGNYKGVDYFATSSEGKTSVAFIAGLFEPPLALSLEGGKVCVTTVSYQPAQCYDSVAKVKNKTVHHDSSFKQTLIYNGSVGDKINISYREFSNNMARDSFTNNVEYDMKKSKVINYKGSEIEVLTYDNTSIQFIVRKHFRDDLDTKI
jgi:hypothetical protein